MSALAVNSVISDNDRRMGIRKLRVTCIDGDFVYAVTSIGREVRINRKRIYADGKLRKTGFDLVVTL